MKAKIKALDFKDWLLILLFGLNIYQHYQIRQLKNDIKEYKHVQSSFVIGVQKVLERKQKIDSFLDFKNIKIDSLQKISDSLGSELSILNNRLYRLNKHNEKKYHKYDTASVNQLKQYFSDELFKN